MLTRKVRAFVHPNSHSVNGQAANELWTDVVATTDPPEYVAGPLARICPFLAPRMLHSPPLHDVACTCTCLCREMYAGAVAAAKMFVQVKLAKPDYTETGWYKRYNKTSP